MSRLFEEDAMWLAWKEAASRIYDPIYYGGNPFVSRINDAGHRRIEQWFSDSDHLSQVLEVGAGTGYHLPFVRHRFDRYIMTDLSPDILALAKKKHGERPDLEFAVADATSLDYEDETFDRLISVYNLEHLPNPHNVLKEWTRITKKNGVLSIAIPLDGGVAWRLGRHLTTRRSFAREGLDLDYIIAREHINPSYNLISLIRHYFDTRTESWFPLRVPLVDVNLVYCCHLKKQGGY